MSTTHTPGPWRATTGNCGQMTGLMSETGAVAMLGMTASLNPADVSLIAAAPDCHEALSTAPVPSTDDVLAWLHDYSRWYHGERAKALAKAEGGVA